MKFIITDYEEAMELVNQISQFDPMSMEIITCMIIDTESAKYEEAYSDILDRICGAVHGINEDLGTYQLDKKGES